ncbi:Hypothetical_protein [Hexamita inflata]|uniref:Hypothetical_protein n=1 Tax=Hexamita inflata TaxID=28002 RepID=A0AA86TA78_9EUKA|nr:Hypothetical protein HINF_LOCUS1049 [Hexamita inflata]
MSKQVGWRINKDVEPAPIEGKQWRWNENKGWLSVKKVDINIKLPDKEGYDQKFVEGKGYQYVKVKNDQWKTDKSIKPISKLIDKDYEWNDKKGNWVLKKRQTEKIEIQEKVESKETREPREDDIQNLRNEILKIQEKLNQTKQEPKQEPKVIEESKIVEEPKQKQVEEAPQSFEEIYDNPIFKSKVRR